MLAVLPIIPAYLYNNAYYSNIMLMFLVKITNIVNYAEP